VATTLEQVIELVRTYCREVAGSDAPIHLDVTFCSGRHLSHPVPPTQKEAEAPISELRSGAQTGHSPDFRSIRWLGREWPFTEMQARVVKTLWEAWEDGSPDVGTTVLIAAAQSESTRVRDLFHGNAAWGTVIVPGGSRGTFRLVD